MNRTESYQERCQLHKDKSLLSPGKKGFYVIKQVACYSFFWNVPLIFAADRLDILRGSICTSFSKQEL